MKQTLLTIVIAFISLNLAAITQPKPIDPVVFSVALPKDKAWQKVVDLFVANSIPIKFMDKSSGLIQSDRLGLGTHYTWKGADDSTSWALCEAVPSGEGSGYYLFPDVINTDLQVYVREVDADNVLLSVNLMNIKAESHNLYGEFVREFDVKTSKRLEKQIGDFVMTNVKMPNLTFDPPYATYGEPPVQTRKRNALKNKSFSNGGSVKEEEAGWILLGIGAIVALFLLMGKKEE
jgi:hypothetical protein